MELRGSAKAGQTSTLGPPTCAAPKCLALGLPRFHPLSSLASLCDCYPRCSPISLACGDPSLRQSRTPRAGKTPAPDPTLSHPSPDLQSEPVAHPTLSWPQRSPMGRSKHCSWSTTPALCGHARDHAAHGSGVCCESPQGGLRARSAPDAKPQDGLPMTHIVWQKQVQLTDNLQLGAQGPRSHGDPSSCSSTLQMPRGPSGGHHGGETGCWEESHLEWR